MAMITRSSKASTSTLNPPASNRFGSGLIAGEDLPAMCPCYVKASDGRVWKSNGTALNPAADVVGWTAMPADAGEPVTLMFDVSARYGSGLTPGAKLYAFTTAGEIADAPTTGGLNPCAIVIDATRIHVMRAVN